MKILPTQIWMYFFILAVGGCATLTHYQELIVLKRVADSQKEIEDDLKEQEELFYKLRKDLKNNRLTEGMLMQEILSAYGEPVLSKEAPDKDKIKEVFLYRHPTDFFSSDRIYLYFDEGAKLTTWELKPGAPAKE